MYNYYSSLLNIDISSERKFISASFYPFFGYFRSVGPIITSLATAREVILMGPWTGNAQKTGKTRRKWIFFVLRNQNSLKLKKVVYITVYFTLKF